MKKIIVLLMLVVLFSVCADAQSSCWECGSIEKSWDKFFSNPDTITILVPIIVALDGKYYNGANGLWQNNLVYDKKAAAAAPATPIPASDVFTKSNLTMVFGALGTKKNLSINGKIWARDTWLRGILWNDGSGDFKDDGGFAEYVIKEMKAGKNLEIPQQKNENYKLILAALMPEMKVVVVDKEYTKKDQKFVLGTETLDLTQFANKVKTTLTQNEKVLIKFKV